LRRLAALERQKIEDEHKEVLATIAFLEDLLASPHKVLALIKDDLKELAEKYGDERRTRIAADATEEMRDEDLVPDEAVLISITHRGYIKRVAAKAYRAQSRGGRGVKGQELREEDAVVYLFPARSLDTILFFSDKGKVYSEKAYQIPDADRTDRGIPLSNILSVESGERITAAVNVPSFDDATYCTMVTRKGKIKRVALHEFSAVRPSGLIAITLEDGDQLGWTKLTRGSEDIIIITERGQALRYNEDAVRAMGRSAGGVTAIRLDEADFVTSMEVVPEGEADLLVVTARGYGKRTPLSDYPRKGRATGGVATIAQRTYETTGSIVAARVVREEDDLTIISEGGTVLRTRMKDIRRAGRATMGTRVMHLRDGDTVASVARLSAEDIAPRAEEPANGKADGATAQPVAEAVMSGENGQES
jgi:DNA gyrase subunit A